MNDLHKDDREQSFRPGSEPGYEPGYDRNEVSEPFWMQDIRLATRRIEEARQPEAGDCYPEGQPDTEG